MVSIPPYVRSAKTKVSEMAKLANLLTEANVPYEVRYPYGAPQVCYPKYGPEMVCDAICHRGSYGFEAGLLEIMGLVDVEEVGDEVEGYLTAEEVAKRIISHYKSQSEN